MQKTRSNNSCVEKSFGKKNATIFFNQFGWKVTGAICAVQVLKIKN